MANIATELNSASEADALVEQIRRARQWAWDVFDHRVPGVARDLAWALIELARDHDPETYSPWLQASALEADRLALALDLAADISHLIRKADRLQPRLVREGEAAR
jgi:hypothetical protein